MYDIVILTCEKYVSPIADTQYIQNVLLEDQLIQDALEHQGFNTNRVAWSDPHFDWSSTQYALFRTTWDYFERNDDFMNWLEMVAKKTRLINSYELTKWNLDKHYLQDLASKGVNVVETHFIEAGRKTTLYQLHKKLGLRKSVLKPAFSAAARETYRLNYKDLSAYEDPFRRLIANEAMLLQPFIYSVVERGEISLMMIGDQYSHAVLKVAKQGDFRVQDDFGGTVHPYTPSKEEIALAKSAIRACSQHPIYARVDIVNDNKGKPAVSELELVEPEMWFRERPEAADELAKCIYNMII